MTMVFRRHTQGTRKPSRNQGPSRQSSTTDGPGMSVWPLGWPGSRAQVCCVPSSWRKEAPQTRYSVPSGFSSCRSSTGSRLTLVPCLRRRAEASSDALAPLRRAEGDSVVIREELSRLFKIEERHRRLLARLVLAFGLSILVYATGAVLTWVFEGGQKGGDIKGFGDAAFFAAVQLLTVSSKIK